MRLTVQGRYTDFGLVSLALNVRFGSFATEALRARADQCPLCLQ
jgi:hypothetical protein